MRTRQDDPEGHAEVRSNLAHAHLDAGSAASIARAVELLEDARQFHANAGMTTQWLNDTCNLARALALTGNRNDLVRGVELLREAAAAADHRGAKARSGRSGRCSRRRC